MAGELVMVMVVVVMMVVIMIIVVMVMVVIMVVVVRLVMALVMALAALHVLLRGAHPAKQHVGGEHALFRRDDLHRRTDAGRHFGAHTGQRLAVDEIGLVEHNEIGADELVLEQFLDRAFMIERLVGGALCGKRRLVAGDAPFRDGGRIDHRDDRVDRDPRPDARPVEGAHQRLRAGQGPTSR